MMENRRIGDGKNGNRRKQTRKDDTTYVLCFFTADRFFFVYDLAQKVENGKYTYCDYSNESVFLKTDNGNYKYFLPAKAEELKLHLIRQPRVYDGSYF